MRIDQRLTTQFPYSRNFFQHILDAGRIQIKSTNRDWFTPKKSYQLQPNDQIQIDDLSRYLDGGILEECPEIPLDIRHETPDYLVLYKPKGILSHPTSVREVGQPNVVGGLYHYLRKQTDSSPVRGGGEAGGVGGGEAGGVGGDPNFIRAGLVHRLDKETDGLMIIAKTERGLQHFKELFQLKSGAASVEEKEAVPLHKYYRATCELTPAGKKFLDQIRGNLPYYIHEMVIPNTPHSVPKMGITKIEKIEEAGEIVKIELEILTGRTHQIRYHLSQHGLPIVNDYLYGNKKDLPLLVNEANAWERAGVRVLQLTAWKLEFVDPEGKYQTFLA